MRKRRVVGTIYRMKYSWRAIKTETDTRKEREKISKRRGQYRNIPTTWTSARGNVTGSCNTSLNRNEKSCTWGSISHLRIHSGVEGWGVGLNICFGGTQPWAQWARNTAVHEVKEILWRGRLWQPPEPSKAHEKWRRTTGCTDENERRKNTQSSLSFDMVWFV